MLTIRERADRLNRFIDEGRVIRGQWHLRDADGRELACLLAAWAPEITPQNPSAARCPADAMPRWLACLTPWIDDRGSLEAWPTVVRRFAAVLPKIVQLPAETLRRLEYGVMWVALLGRVRRGASAGVAKACRVAGDICLRVAVGDRVTPADWRNADRLVGFASETARSALSEADWACSDACRYSTSGLGSEDALIDQILTLFEYVVA